MNNSKGRPLFFFFLITYSALLQESKVLSVGLRFTSANGPRSTGTVVGQTDFDVTFGQCVVVSDRNLACVSLHQTRDTV